MSSLAKQLDFLRSKDQQNARVSEKRQASILFDPKEAGKIDIDQIQSMAAEGFHNLVQIIPTLSAHQNLVFENKFIDRMKLTKAENDALSVKIMSLLRELSRNLLNTNTMKILEYLLRNYHIYLHEAEYTIVAFLAFHSTPQFIKLIQNVDITAKTNRFNFLNSNSLTGQPVSREFLVRACQLDPSILESYRNFLLECQTDSAATSSLVFIPAAFRTTQAKSPSLGFLLSLLSECLGSPNRKQADRFRLVALKLILDTMKFKQDEEGFACVLLILTELVVHQLVTPEVLLATFSDIVKNYLENPSITDSIKEQSFKPALSKFVVFSFQQVPNLELNSELVRIIESALLNGILSSRARLVQLAIKYSKYSCFHYTSDSETLRKILSTIHLGDNYIRESNEHLIRFIIVCFRSTQHGNPPLASVVIGVLKAVFGQSFYDALTVLQASEGISETEKQVVEEILSESVLHRLVQIKDVSKISLLNGMRHPNTAVKSMSIKLLLESDPKALTAPSVIHEVMLEIRHQFDPDILNNLLKFPLKEVSLDSAQVDSLFVKYLAVANQAVRNHIKLIASSHVDLKRKLDILELLFGKTKTLKTTDISEEFMIQTVKQICENTPVDFELNFTVFGNALLSAKLYNIFLHCIDLITTFSPQSLGTLTEVFTLNFNSGLTALDLNEFTSGLKVIDRFRSVSSEFVFEPKDGSMFLKMVLVLLFAQEDSVEPAVLDVISQALATIKEINLKDIEDLDKRLLVLMLKGLRNPQLKNGYFLKILQTIRFGIKQENLPGLQIYKHLLKKLITHKFEFESGAFGQFDVAELKSLRDFMGDNKPEILETVISFFKFCLETTVFYPELIEFIKILCSIKYSNPSLIKFITETASKITVASDFRQPLARALFDLYFIGSTEKSSPIENALSRLRAFVDLPFDYMTAKSDYAGYLDLIEIYMESNFKTWAFIADIKLEPTVLVSLAQHIISKNHEGLIGSLCIILINESTVRQQDLNGCAGLFVCYHLVYQYLLSGKAKKEETESTLVKTLRAIYLCLNRSDLVKIVFDRETMKSKTSPLGLKFLASKHPQAKQLPHLEVVEENKKTRLVVIMNSLFQADVYEFLEKKVHTAVGDLVAIKYEKIAEEVDDESLDKFIYIRNIIEYLLQANKQLKTQIEGLIRTILNAFASSVENIRNSIRGEANKHKSSKGLDFEKGLDPKHSFMLSRLDQEIDFLMHRILKIIAEQFGNKKLKICAEVFLFWMLLVEKHRNNSLMRLLSNFYKKSEKKGRQLNPLSDPEIYYFSKYIRTITKDIFGQENTDVVLNIIITLYIFTVSNQVENKAQLHFTHLCHFMILHMLDRQEEVLTNCNLIVDTLNNGISTLKGFLPSNSKKINKQPKSKLIKDFLKRTDPFDPASANNAEKLRSMRFCMIYMGFLNLAMRDKRLTRYIQAAILAQNNDYKESPLMKKLEDLLLTTFRFDAEFETLDANYRNKVKVKKESIVSLFSKIGKLCELNIRSISELIPIELYPLSITDRMGADAPEYSILLRISNALLYRIDTSRISPEFMDFFETCLLKFISQGQVFLNSSDKSKTIGKFIQSIFVIIGLLHKKSQNRIEQIVNPNLDSLVEIASKQQNPIVHIACLGSLSLFSRNQNDSFIGRMDQFFRSFEQFIIQNYHSKNPSLFGKINSSLKAVPRKKLVNGEVPTNPELIRSWLKTLSTLVASLGNMVEPYLARIILYVAFIHQEFSEQRVTVRATIEEMVKSIEERILLEPLGGVVEAITQGHLHIDETVLLNLFVDGILHKIKKEDFADHQDKLFELIRDLLKTVTVNFDKFKYQSYHEVIDGTVKLVSSFALKCSESTFKRYFETFVKWSKITYDYESESEEMMERKLNMVRILNQLIRTLGRFGVNYYGHVYDYYLGFMDHCLAHVRTPGQGKRDSSFASARLIELHRYIMESLELLYRNDKKKFVDNLRFEKTVKPLTGQLHLIGLSEDFFKYALEFIVPPLLSLVNLVSDDYMWKTILYNICTQLRTSSILVRKVIVSTAMKLIDTLADRFVIILNDFIPFLSEMLDDEEPEVSALARGIVKQLSQYTSEDIYALIKASS